MSILQAIIFGIVEGITEFLPISSTGHLILTAELLNLKQTEFIKTFEIAIQLGAILSVVVLYWRQLFVNIATMKRIATAFIPTAILGLALYRVVKYVFFANNQIVLWSLLIGGVLLIVFEYWHKEREDAHEELATLPYRKAVIIGLAQGVAMIPGVSRAAATILGGLLLGLKRKTIVEFSFLLAVPTMLAATVLDVSQNASRISSQEFMALAVGFVVSFIVALLAIRFLLKFIQHHSFTSFGIYRVVIALVFWLVIL